VGHDGDLVMSEERARPIEAPYLLVLNITLVADGGRYWAGPLWYKDLLLHLVAIERLTLACPVEHRAPEPGWLPIEDPGITILPLPPMGDWRTVLDIPLIASRLWRATGKARIVHTGIAGWPYPLGWIAAPIARLRRRFLMIGVESSFWRVPAGMAASPAQRAKAAIFEWLNRQCLDAADLTFFTTEEYRASMLRNPRGPSHVTPATWVDPEHLIGADALERSWAAKDGRLLFAARLTEAKGVKVLIEAVERSAARVDIIGEGDLLEDVRALAARLPDRVRLLEPVAYGPDFSALLDGYAAIIVPTLSEEQPRILFDAYARGVPAIASDTSGNRQLVHDRVEGRLVPAGDAAALAAALDDVAADIVAYADMGRLARATMDLRTHEAMHRARIDMIAQSLRR
jgi:glycosyltransferase involved in cell wall biosynthesis